ncbi:MAG: glycoside hydrolase family 65 protein [Streptococcaceae bacterium]|jgi:maltose phosphorylase|nr:glycoside hydrolase family 65 protein [Streptococcaceae bacterium]
MNEKKNIFDIDPWKIKTNQLYLKEHRLQESLTSIGNGYMGMRGNFEEKYSGDSHQGTYIAGVWFPDKTRVGWWKNGYPDYFGKAINALNFIKINLSIDGKEIDLAKTPFTNFYQELDMKRGVLLRRFQVFGVEIKIERFASVDFKELAVIKWTFQNKDKKHHCIEINSSIDANVENEDSNYDEKFWQVLDKSSEKDGSWIETQTINNPFGVEQFIIAARQSYVGDFSKTTQKQEDFQVSDTFIATLEPEKTLCFEKRVIVTTSRDYKDSTEVKQALEELTDKVKKQTFEQLLFAHEQEWENRWNLADVVIEGNDESQQGIRFNLFQLFSTYYGEDERLNIGPKGFTGEKYGGATYWDTEAYAVPLYLALAKPEVSKNLLKYRYNQLAQAKHNARQQGLKGALYPMVTFTGVECHNEWEITFEEIHRNGAMAYAIYNYTNYTGDDSYLKNEGLEVLVEISRFWADRVHFSKNMGKYMIHGVTGPNEYENNVNNNWYTNTLAKWVLQYTIDSLQKYLREDLLITKDEKNQWQVIADNMYLPFDDKKGIFVQHDTFLDKELMSVKDLDASNLPLNQNWSWDKILRSCFIKQADVLQGIYLFGNDYTMEEKKANFEFYEPMTVHESSLSPSIHSILAAELGMEEKAFEMYERTARLDLDNYNNDTQDGLHITSMTGSWLAIVQGFAQMKTWNEQLSFAPILPKNWAAYSFNINYRGTLLNVRVADKLTLLKKSGKDVLVNIYGKKVVVKDKVEINLG